MDNTQIVGFILGLIAAEADAETAWSAVSKIVSESRDPTAAEWHLADSSADQAHAAVQALKGQ